MKDLFHQRKPIELFLNRNLEKSIKAGHPWIYSDSITRPSSPSAGQANLKNKKGEIVARGIYDPESPLAFRVCVAGDAPMDHRWVSENLQKAITERRHILSEETDACRLVFGEGDNLPGLVCDLYNDILVFQLDGQGPARFWNVKSIAHWFSEKLPIKTAYLKYRSDSKKRGEVVLGEKALKKVVIHENGLRFKVDVINGQKTGFFLDQRENRWKVRSYSKGKTVLNLFGYTGGFSVYAGMGQARHVTTVDISRPAVIESQQNWLLNDLKEESHLSMASDAFDFLRQAQLEKKKWDLVVADPPSFASSQKNVEKAKRRYVDLLADSAKVLKKNGVLAASSCSSHIDHRLFYEICREAISRASRKGRVLGYYHQPADHPYPLACQELCYLKFLLVQLD